MGNGKNSRSPDSGHLRLRRAVPGATGVIVTHHAPIALIGQVGYVENMEKIKSIDPIVSNEPEVEVDVATGRVLKQRMKTADQDRLVSAREARQRIDQWFSKSSTTKTR